MEIRDYLRVVKRRLWILVVLPVLAAAVGILAFSGQPQQFRSSVETSVPSLAINTTAGAVSVYVANFQELLTTQPVIDRITKETGVAGHDLRSGLTASQVGTTSNLIRVTYTSTTKANVEKVALSATNATLDMASEPAVANAKAAVVVAQERFDRAQKAVQQLVASPSPGLPIDQYRDKLSSLATLKLAASSARLDADIPKADGLDAQIPGLEKEIADLVPKVQQYQQLSDAQQQASTALSTALVREQDTEAQVAAHADRSALRDSSPTKVDSAQKLATSVGMVAGIGLVLAGLIIVFLELINAGRARRADERVLLTDGTQPVGGDVSPAPRRRRAKRTRSRPAKSPAPHTTQVAEPASAAAAEPAVAGHPATVTS